MASPGLSRSASPRSPLSSPGSDHGSAVAQRSQASVTQLQQHKTDLITGAMPPTSITAGQLQTLKLKFDDVSEPASSGSPLQYA